MRIIPDRNAYKTVRRVRGVADARKPNSRRPFFYGYKAHIPLAYLIKAQNTIIAHPDIIAKLQTAAEPSTAPFVDYAMSSLLFQRPVFEPPTIDQDAFQFRFRYGFGLGAWSDNLKPGAES